MINQTYNAVLNYGNANATSPYTKQDLAMSYCMAVSVSMAVALTVRQVNLKRTLAATGSSLILLNAATSTTAAACGGFANNYFMRQSELERGIELCDPETGKPLGKSKLTAKSAVMQTASSRIVMALPICLPAFALIAIEKAGVMPKNRYLALAV